ncbi:MAG TPA: hypothetical protein OGM06_05015 [Clostridiales bacterium]|nr:hypothetical protein [Clostridiales bacterium]
MKKRKSPVEGLQCSSCGDGIGSVWQTTGKVCEGRHGQGSPARAFFGCKGAAEGMRFFPGMEIMLMGFGETRACRVHQQFSAKMAFLLP